MALVHPPTSRMIHHIMSNHIMARGDNQRPLVRDAITQSHGDALRIFLSRLEECEEGEVDGIVEIRDGISLEKWLIEAIEGCVWIPWMERRSEKKVEEVLEVVKEYKLKTQGRGPSKKDKTPWYYGFLPEVDL